MRNMNIGTVNGGNNEFNQNNNFHIKNSGGGGSHDSDPAGEGMTILIGIFGVVVATAFVYLRYYEPIFFYLKLGVFGAGVLYVMAIVSQWRGDDYRYRTTLLTAFGMLLTMAQMYVIYAIQEALPSAMIDAANQPTVATAFFQQAFEVWNRFNDVGHRLITENLTAVLCLTPAIVLNLAYGLQNLLALLARSEQSRVFAMLARWLQGCKVWGGPVSAALTFFAYLAISGVFTSHAL